MSLGIDPGDIGGVPAPPQSCQFVVQVASLFEILFGDQVVNRLPGPVQSIPAYCKHEHKARP